MPLVATSFVARLAALFAAVTLAVTPAHAGFFTSAPGSLESITVGQLPVTAEPQGALWHLNLSPFGCSGCMKHYASANGTFTVNAYVTWWVSVQPNFQNFIPHPGGWEFRHIGGSCLSSRLEARRIGSLEVESVALLEKDRLLGFASRRMHCLGGNSTVYYSVVANSRYLAFMTAEPGFVFFDLQEGRFVPWALTSDRADGDIDLYADQSGALYVYTGVGSSTGTLHRAVLGGRDLVAPLSKDLICEARVIAKRIDPNWETRPALGFECP